MLLFTKPPVLSVDQDFNFTNQRKRHYHPINGDKFHICTLTELNFVPVCTRVNFLTMSETNCALKVKVTLPVILYRTIPWNS